MEEETIKLSKAISSFDPQYYSPYGEMIPEIETQLNITRVFNFPTNYKEEVKQCRYFYKYDPIASSVINRMADMAVVRIHNQKNDCNYKELEYYNYVLSKYIFPLLNKICIEYLTSGLVVPDYGLKRIKGSDMHKSLGRTKFYVPDPLWIRNSDHIEIKSSPVGGYKEAYLKIPPEEIEFVQNQGRRKDGSYDKDLYKRLTDYYPEYVRLINAGVNSIYLPVRPILRKPPVNSNNPLPFLIPALSSLKHKLRIKQMDYVIASRAIEAIMLIQAGDKDFPVTEDDTTLEDLRNQMTSRSKYGSSEAVYKLFTNHTVKISWSYPPLDALLSDEKFSEPNADIFLALGFPRILLIGETLRSNSGQAITTTMGPIAALEEMRNTIVQWINSIYEDLANKNNFDNIPLPAFAPITSSEVVELIKYAVDAAGKGYISRNTIAKMLGTDFNSEIEQRLYEDNTLNNIEKEKVVVEDPKGNPEDNTRGGDFIDTNELDGRIEV